MSRLLLLAGTAPLAMLGTRSSYTTYEGCYSLDTSTASSIYNLDPSDPPACAAACGGSYPHTAMLAQSVAFSMLPHLGGRLTLTSRFCYCFPSPPDLLATYNDSACSINCDMPYQDESCGGITPGTLIDVYSYYSGSNVAAPYGGEDTGSSAVASSPTTSEQADTSVGSPNADGPTATGDAGSPTTTPGSDDSMTAVETPTQAVSTHTITIALWTTVTSYTTVFPGGPLQSTVFSSPTAITSFTAQLFTTSYSDVTVTVTCDEDGSETTSVVPGSVHVVTYIDPGESQIKEGEVKEVVETEGSRVVLAAVVPRTVSVGGLGGERGGLVYGEARALGNGTEPSGYGTGAGTGLVASPTAVQLPVTAGAGKRVSYGLGWTIAAMLCGAVLGVAC